MKMRIQSAPLILSLLLTACASVPSPTPHRPAPPVANLTIDMAPPVERPALPAPPVVDVWDRLRSSFAMADCDADPSILAWAKRYTRNPEQFESQLQTVLPRLVYVQQIAARYDVAGEFVLLPWVESHFQPVAGRRNRPAGMWQIMPVTAGAMGLRVDGHYDGRLDVPAAADAVMKLLRQYHDQFQDWRVTDYAYNAGEFSVKKIIRKHGMPAATPVIPRWPVRGVTREHLTKLLAMACVVREPTRFHVNLPALPSEQRLVQVKLPHSMSIARAADHAGLSVDALKDLNAAFRNDTVDADAASYLLLPVSHVQQFRNALVDQPAGATADNRSDRGVASTAATQARTAAGSIAPRKTHRVRRGDTLWQIARHYSVSITQLKHWNHLQGRPLKPGQVLQVSGAN